MEAHLLDRTLLYVTGKGGVGKTTVAAALGMAAAGRGRRTIVCEVAEQDRVSRAFAREGVQREQEVELAPNLWAITIDPTAALREWLERQLGGAALRLIAGSSAFQHFVAAAPGAKELITIAKVWELAQLERWDAANRTYDLVIVDAPASGHGLAMLTAPQTFGEIARVGPIRRQAFKVRDMLADGRRTGYVAVALPEEMPVNETLELGARLEAAVGLGLDAIVVNGLYPERFTRQGGRRAARARRRLRAPSGRRSPSTSAAASSAATCAGSSARPPRPSPRCPTSSSRTSASTSTARSRPSSAATWDDRRRPAAAAGRDARGALAGRGRGHDGDGGDRRGRRARARRSAAGSRALAWAAVALVAAGAIGVAPELRWRRWRWDVGEDDVEIRSGTLTVTHTVVPLRRVQHVDTHQGLLEQALGLATVALHTAAGTNKIPALARARRRGGARPHRRAHPHRR